MNLIEALKTGKVIYRTEWGPRHPLVVQEKTHFFPSDILSDWSVIENKGRKRFLAWIASDPTLMVYGQVLFIELGQHPDDSFPDRWTRAPWLDEPEDK